MFELLFELLLVVEPVRLTPVLLVLEDVPLRLVFTVPELLCELVYLDL